MPFLLAFIFRVYKPSKLVLPDSKTTPAHCTVTGTQIKLCNSKHSMLSAIKARFCKAGKSQASKHSFWTGNFYNEGNYL